MPSRILHKSNSMWTDPASLVVEKLVAQSVVQLVAQLVVQWGFVELSPRYEWVTLICDLCQQQSR